jgi:hypothetical protein
LERKVSALFIGLAVGAGFLFGLRVGLALGHKNALKQLARKAERERAALKR